MIKGMRKGKLDPHFFGRFELQDGRYFSEEKDILLDRGNILKEKYPGFHIKVRLEQASKYD